MAELFIKQVRLFKFVQENGSQLNIYVEPIKENTGRLIVATTYKIFQRYFDGANGGIYAFLSKQPAPTIAYCFESVSEEDHEYILKRLLPVWEQFIESIKSEKP